MFNNPTIQSIATIGASVLLVIVFVLLALLLMWLSLVLLKRIQREMARAGVTPGQVDETLDWLQGLPAAIQPLLDEPTDLAIILIASALRKDPVAVVNRIEVVLRAAAKLTGFLPEVRDAFGLNPQVPQEADSE